MRYVLLCLLFSASAALATDWADQASERIPTPTHTGVVNTRFQWMPGPMVILDIAEHYHVREWLNHHQDVILKYLPKVIQYAAKWNQEKNYILALIPAAMKILHKGIK